MEILIGILIGFILALPPGGVALIGVHLALGRGWRRAAPYAFGSMIADSVYAIGALFAAEAISAALVSFAEGFPTLILIVKGATVAALLYAGVRIVMRRDPVAIPSPESHTSGTRRFSARGPFLLGLGVNLSNAFVSPSFLVALTLFVAQAGAFGILEGSDAGYVRYGVGFGIGNLLYMLLLMRAAVSISSRLHGRQVLVVQRVVGCTLAALGLVLGAHVLDVLKA